MTQSLNIGDFELTWLNGGTFELDGGAMFGVVPKVLWQKKYPPVEDNYIPLTAWPILVRTPSALVLIESGLGNKLTDKQRKIYRVREEWSVIGDLKRLGIGREDKIVERYEGGPFMDPQTWRRDDNTQRNSAAQILETTDLGNHANAQQTPQASFVDSDRIA